MVQLFGADKPGDAESDPGLPLLKSWRSVYTAVLATLFIYVFGLALLTRLAR